MRVVLLDCGIIKDPLRSRSLKIIEVINDLGYEIQRVEVLEGEKIDDDLENITHIIISGSGLNYDSNHLGICYVRDVVKQVYNSHINVLGVCFGAQVLADVLGGSVEKQKNTEFGFETISIIKEDTLMSEFPQEFDAFEYHFDSITSLPSYSILIAQSENCIQVYKTHNCYGVQFHPEIDSVFAKREIEIIEENNLQESVKSKEIFYTLPRKIFENFLKL
ncbi:MAG: type 1 glutamine amidotransferase [Candidatus Nanoarchaeia archaeon]